MVFVARKAVSLRRIVDAVLGVRPRWYINNLFY